MQIGIKLLTYFCLVWDSEAVVCNGLLTVDLFIQFSLLDFQLLNLLDIKFVDLRIIATLCLQITMHR